MDRSGRLRYYLVVIHQRRRASITLTFETEPMVDLSAQVAVWPKQTVASLCVVARTGAASQGIHSAGIRRSSAASSDGDRELMCPRDANMCD